MDIKLIIPARYQSTRFPGKPLVSIAGIPMLKRVFDQCAKAFDSKNIFVATDSTEIVSYCESVGIQAVITSTKCLTGTDRVAEAADIIGGDIFINVQGDEPLFNPSDIKILLDEVTKDSTRVYCGYTALTSEKEFRSLAVPKMVFSKNGRLLYTSRSPIPGSKVGDYAFGYRQICAYAFPYTALKKFASALKKEPLEEKEDLELLRFLEMDFPVYMLEMSNKSIPVDYPEDLVKVENELKLINGDNH